MKWNLSLKVIMYKPTDPSVVTDPPAVFNTDAIFGLIGSNYDSDLNSAFYILMQKIDEYEQNGSGWVIGEIVELDVSIITCNPWKRCIDSDGDIVKEDEGDDVKKQSNDWIN